ncbi:MAG: tetrahydromethanopterin S-methyltransferase subunit A [Euryarchaeota archaeon]|nr:tetrahydromethanopterin S-methyltransferase subunit A [Euryarchaeota archaeon]
MSDVPPGLSTDERPRDPYDARTWPSIRGDYSVGDPDSRIAVVTLASQFQVEGAAICGPCKTENLGVEKVVANVISNSNIRFLLVCGSESRGHLPGDTILALHMNGIDESGRILGSKGAIPFIENLPPEAVSRFQRQVVVIDRIGHTDTEEIAGLVREHRDRSGPYPKPPMEVVKRRTRTAAIVSGDGDVFLGAGVQLDSSAWAVVEVATIHPTFIS